MRKDEGTGKIYLFYRRNSSEGMSEGRTVLGLHVDLRESDFSPAEGKTVGLSEWEDSS